MIASPVMFAGVFACIAATACSAPTSVCTADFRYGLAVRVQDSVSGAWIGSGSTLVAEDGSFRDSVVFPTGRTDLDADALPTAGERPGTYSLTLRHDGYVTWSRAGVTVIRGSCH